MERRLFVWLFGLLVLSVVSAILFASVSKKPLAFSSSRLAAQVLTALPEEIQSGTQLGVTREELSSTQQRADDLLRFIGELQKRLDSLPVPPSPLPPGAIAFTGIQDSVSFGYIPIFTSADKTFQILTAAARPVSFVELAGLAEPFSFKGGSFPGTGGTCTPAISENCTVVLTFAPRGVGGAGDGNNQLKWRLPITVKFKDGAEPGQSAPRVIGGQSDDNSAIADLAAEPDIMPRPLLPGEAAQFAVTLRLRTSGGRRVFFKDVAVSGVAEPFSILQNDCTSTPVHIDSCSLKIQFAPSRSGAFSSQANFSVDAGVGPPKILAVTLSGMAVSSSQELDASRNVLVVYNEDWHESVAAKNYYLTHRPKFAAANTLGIHFPVPAGCNDIACLSQVIGSVPYREIPERIVNPIVAWLREHPEKDIQYIALMRGVPSRNTNETDAEAGGFYSAQHLIRAAIDRVFSREVFISSVDTGSLESTRRYIDKLKRVHDAMPAPALLISARGTSMAGTTYYLSDSYLGEGPDVHRKYKATAFAEAMRTAHPSAHIVTQGNVLPRLSSASDVTGFLIHGSYGYGEKLSNGSYTNRDYALNGSIRFSGNSGWYAMTTWESYNGVWPWGNGSQGDFISWFSRNAFGGSNYEYTPAAAVTHVKEPTSNAQQPGLFACWEAGKPFAYCAWKNDGAGELALQVVGDPLVTR